MAGDWIKMRVDLRDDPAVFLVAEILSVDEFTVVGMLHAFWAWMDKYSVDGCVDGATSHLVDKKVIGIPGFSDALVKVKWLEFDINGAKMPKYGRHNGKSAKERLLKNQRQAAWREGSKAVDGYVDKNASTREEKRREDIKSSSPRKNVGLKKEDPGRIDKKLSRAEKLKSVQSVLDKDSLLQGFK